MLKNNFSLKFRIIAILNNTKISDEFKPQNESGILIQK